MAIRYMRMSKRSRYEDRAEPASEAQVRPRLPAAARAWEGRPPFAEDLDEGGRASSKGPGYGEGLGHAPHRNLGRRDQLRADLLLRAVAQPQSVLLAGSGGLPFFGGLLGHLLAALHCSPAGPLAFSLISSAIGPIRSSSIFVDGTSIPDQETKAVAPIASPSGSRRSHAGGALGALLDLRCLAWHLEIFERMPSTFELTVSLAPAGHVGLVAERLDGAAHAGASVLMSFLISRGSWPIAHPPQRCLVPRLELLGRFVTFCFLSWRARLPPPHRRP